MAESPSPYAPGIIGDEPAPPRPAGRPVVFLVATFVMAILTTQLWQEWSSRAMLLTGRSSSVQTAVLLASLPGGLALLWAYLSDAVPLWGTRREGYLMLACIVTAIVWLGLGVASGRQMAWLVAAAPLGTATSVSQVAIIGALTEIGRRRAATGQLAALHNALVQLAVLASQPLLVWSAWSAFASIWLIAGVAAGLALAVMMLIATVSDDGTPSPPASAPIVGIPAFLRSPALWRAVPVLVCAGAATIPYDVMMLGLRDRFGDHTYVLFGHWTTPAIAIAAAVAYLLVWRRLRFGTLLRLALLAKAIALAACALALRGNDEALLRLALMARTGGDGVAAVAILDLAMRVAPRGREAFGAILLNGLPYLVIAAVTAFAIPQHTPLIFIASFATSAAIAGVLAVSLLRPDITGYAESR